MSTYDPKKEAEKLLHRLDGITDRAERQKIYLEILQEVKDRSERRRSVLELAFEKHLGIWDKLFNTRRQ